MAPRIGIEPLPERAIIFKENNALWPARNYGLAPVCRRWVKFWVNFICLPWVTIIASRPANGTMPRVAVHRGSEQPHNPKKSAPTYMSTTMKVDYALSPRLGVGHFKRMFRVVITFLWVAVLFLSNGAWSATTFKDGKISSSNSAPLSNRAADIRDLSKYDEFRAIEIEVAEKKYFGHTAFSERKTLFGFRANGVLVYQNEICDWQSIIRNSKTKTGAFTAHCPSGWNVEGSFTFIGYRQGSYGFGTDKAGREVRFRLKGRGSSTLTKTQQFFSSLGEATENQSPAVAPPKPISGGLYASRSDADVCKNFAISNLAKEEAKRRELICGSLGEVVRAQSSEASDISTASSGLYTDRSDASVCENFSNSIFARNEAKRRGLRCVADGLAVRDKLNTSSPQTDLVASEATSLTPSLNSEELENERRRRIKLEQELAKLRAQQATQQVQATTDNQPPLIDIVSAETKGKQGIIKGQLKDNLGLAELTIDGIPVPFTREGKFEHSIFVPSGGISIQLQVTDTAGLTSATSISLKRSVIAATAPISFDRLNPLNNRVAANQDALALIVGIAKYENTPAKAVFADSDALMFRDYASEKLGIPEERIKTLVDDDADIRQVLLSVKNWLARAVKQNESDVYIFFAGHGLATEDGQNMYLLPFDGAPELLQNTAILRDELFSDIAAANPRSVTVFLDTCYSGTTRGPDMLIASRPIAIRAREQSIPDGFTVMTAAASDQTAKPLEEAKHGMFSYFLMKGMEGDADANQNNEITAGELHAYVQQNVIQQSSGSQTPELQGDADRVLVRFQ